MLKRVFISQPMAGEEEADILDARSKAFARAVAELNVEANEVVEIPKFDPVKIRGLRPARCLGMSIELMSDADLVVFAPGWQYARGCRIEHCVCKDYDIPCIEMEDGD